MLCKCGQYHILLKFNYSVIDVNHFKKLYLVLELPYVDGLILMLHVHAMYSFKRLHIFCRCGSFL